MTSLLASSPANPSYIPSLLIPPNPAFVPAEQSPRGGILINPLRTPDAQQSTLPSPSPNHSQRRPSEPSDSPITPTTPLPIPGIAIDGNYISPPKAIPIANTDNPPPRIRFAPLPDPRRPRSLSTGGDIVIKATYEDGHRSHEYAIRGSSRDGDDGAGMDEEGDDEAVDDEDGDDEGDECKRNRRWSKSMGMGSRGMGGWTKGTKKLLGLKEDKEKDDGHTEGAPLKKSSSTGGFVGASPFRWTNETERKRSMQGIPASSSLPASQPLLAPSSSHRRNSSLEPPSSASALGSSPKPVKMLNGRVYGSRRASEAAAEAKVARERAEPAFVEWGHGKAGGGLGSNVSAASKYSGSAADEDGSGMEWVRRRREERERAKEEALRESGSGNSSSDERGLAINTNRGADGRLVTPSIRAEDLPPTPIIHVSEPASPAVEMGRPEFRQKVTDEHVTQAIAVPNRHRMDSQGGDSFGNGDISPGNSEGEESEEDDADFDEDDEDEGDVRTTSSAAGIEIMSRHKD